MATTAPVKSEGPAFTGSTSVVARTPLGDSPGAFRIGGLSDPLKKKWLNMLVYGAPGNGKTTLEGSAVDVEELRDVLFIAAEGGELVLEDNPRVQQSDLLDVVRVQRIEQLQKLYEFLQHHCRLRDNGDLVGLEKLQRMTFGIPDDIEVDRVRQYHTVILDSLTEIEAQNLGKILNLDAQGLDAGADMEVAGFAEFRKNNNMIQRITRQFRDLHLHFLCVCSQRYSQDELKRYHYTPALTGQLVNQIQGFFDIVGWLVVGQPDPGDESGRGPRRLFVQPQSSPKADAKCRLSSYGKAFFDDPTMADIMKATGFISNKR